MLTVFGRKLKSVNFILNYVTYIIVITKEQNWYYNEW